MYLLTHEESGGPSQFGSMKYFNLNVRTLDKIEKEMANTTVHQVYISICIYKLEVQTEKTLL